MDRKLLVSLLIALTTCAACGGRQGLPEDEDLELFIDLSARCAYIDRTYTHDEGLRDAELASVPFPPTWSDLVDTLLMRYGADADFWYEVYSEIMEKSRQPQG
jgi:hypothetical protein